jgi:hypothetical protein
MSRPINPAEITAKMPHIDTAALQGRTMLLMPVWDGTAWGMWVDAPPGQLIKVQIVEPIRSNYLATAPGQQIRPTDSIRRFHVAEGQLAGSCKTDHGYLS